MASSVRTAGIDARYTAGLTAEGEADDTVAAMDASWNPAERQPKGDHNRRLALFLDPAAFAAEAGVTEEALRDYERTPPDGAFDLEIARRVGEALDRLEAATPPSQRVIS
jgi:hypothetical protein